MSFFHKSVNEKLLEHISQLDMFGLLPINWAWHKDKIKSLDTLSKELLVDLILLHNAHQDLGETIPHIIPIIKQLYDNLQTMLKEQPLDSEKQKEEAIIVNRLVEHLRNSLEKQGYVRYGTFRGPIMYLTPKEIAYYNSLVDERKWKEALRYIKNKWNERVDRTFIQSIHTIHWGNFESIEYALTKMSRRDEISCVGYEKPPYLCLWVGGLGIFVQGHVTLAGNVDLQSKQWTGFGKGHRYTEYAERLILNDKTFISRQGFDPRAGFITFGAPHNEFMVANWKPVALIFDENKLNPDDYEKQFGKKSSKKDVTVYLKEFAARLGLPLIDNLGRKN